jgi:glycosyltransferase involved in cell wall biosynthesis
MREGADESRDLRDRNARPLRIAVLARVAMAVRPGEGESIEQLVFLLTEELVRRGHAVTLFATGDSETSAELRSLYSRGYTQDASIWDWRLAEAMHAARAFEQAEEFDLIHSHAHHFALPFTRLVPTPVVTTYHVELDKDIAGVYARCPEARLVAVSDWQRSTLAGIADVPVIPHGIDVGAFPFAPERGNYLLFLGRMIPDKAPVDAIRIAQQAGMPIVLAGPPSDYFTEAVEPLVDGHAVRYAGAVGNQERNRLLAGAAALVFPISYPEPFGLVMVEAMACGTPVVATAVGAAPEIVEPGVTGHVGAAAADLVELVAATVALDRRRVRARAVERFGYARMVDDYEALYAETVARRRAPAS